ncbi:EF-P lysine aminoacylase GenX [Candidatus Gottesmanbacteria bacterium]|nr:EF-P lysine aminoacylase GenX [Candidatus Gottesmanbacteria bacterium]
MKTWEKIRQNPSLLKKYFVRETVIKSIRSFFDSRKFHEVETPLLVARPPAESYVEVFETTLLDRYRNKTRAFLSTSPEIFLKKLLVAGIGNCYSITKSFRNTETQSTLHVPEFTILEWYRVGDPYEKIMDECEKLIRYIHHDVLGDRTFMYQGKRIDIQSSWERMSVREAFSLFAKVDLDAFFDMGYARRIMKKKKYKETDDTTWEEMFHQIFLNEVEPHIGREKPTILYEYPSLIAALSKKKASDPRYAERFEFYIAGLELGDCYSELTDPVEQKKRFDSEIFEIKRLGKTHYEYDSDFIHALEVGLPSCSGIAVGVDRLVMLFSDAADISDTLFFPAKEEFERFPHD